MNKIDLFFIGLLTGIIFMSIIVAIVTDVIYKPTAMDVYQGKTTLEITYRQGIAIDSTVVYKD